MHDTTWRPSNHVRTSVKMLHAESNTWSKGHTVLLFLKTMKWRETLIYNIYYNCQLFTDSVSFVGHIQPVLSVCIPSHLHTQTHAFHKAQYVHHVSNTHTQVVKCEGGECRVFLSHDPRMKHLCDPITLERLSPQCPAYECNSISAGAARPTTDCKCRSEMWEWEQQKERWDDFSVLEKQLPLICSGMLLFYCFCLCFLLPESRPGMISWFIGWPKCN